MVGNTIPLFNEHVMTPPEIQRRFPKEKLEAQTLTEKKRLAKTDMMEKFSLWRDGYLSEDDVRIGDVNLTEMEYWLMGQPRHFPLQILKNTECSDLLKEMLRRVIINLMPPEERKRYRDGN